MPFAREVIVDAGDHYETGRFSWLRRPCGSPDVIPKRRDGPEVARAREAADVRAFLVWSRFPYWEQQPVPSGTAGHHADMRFGDRFAASTIVPGDQGSCDNHEGRFATFTKAAPEAFVGLWFRVIASNGYVSASLTLADVERIAALAHLELTGEEAALFARQLADILHYAEQIQALDTRDVPAHRPRARTRRRGPRR